MFNKLFFIYLGVQIDKEVHDIVVNTFGEWTYSGKKAKRMLYWMPKLKHTNNYLDRRLVENKDLTKFELARIVLKMMCRDAGTLLTNINVISNKKTTGWHADFLFCV